MVEDSGCENQGRSDKVVALGMKPKALLPPPWNLSALGCRAGCRQSERFGITGRMRFGAERDSTRGMSSWNPAYASRVDLTGAFSGRALRLASRAGRIRPTTCTCFAPFATRILSVWRERSTWRGFSAGLQATELSVRRPEKVSMYGLLCNSTGKKGSFPS